MSKLIADDNDLALGMGEGALVYRVRPRVVRDRTRYDPKRA